MTNCEMHVPYCFDNLSTTVVLEKGLADHSEVDNVLKIDFGSI